MKHRRAPCTRLRAGVATVGMFLAIGQTTAATFVVTTTADSNDGACTVSLCSLRDAVIAANANPGADVITVPVGTYVLTIPGTGEAAAATGDLDINGDLTINGAGAATTIVDGGAIDRVFDVISGTVILNDLTIRNGLAAPGESGGGITNTATLTLNRCVVSANQTSFVGGGIFNDSTMTLNDSTVTGNVAGGPGSSAGGVYNHGTMTITRGTISGNSVPTGGDGGGIVNGSALTIIDSTVSGNLLGAAVSSGGGGGLVHSGSLLLMVGTTVSSNAAPAGIGGGILIALGANGATIVNSTISGNSAGAGGGISNGGNGVTIFNTTIASNVPVGINSAYNFAIVNTIVANNGVNCAGTKPTDGGTNMQFPGATCGNAIATADPLLQPLANNGGPTQTQALAPGSPALDAGTTGCPPAPATDQRGVTRPQGLGCDIGSLELRATPALRGVPIPTLNAKELFALCVVLAMLALWRIRTGRP